MSGFPDFVRAPNQGTHSELYEIENRALDRPGVVFDAMRQIAPWSGSSILDLGCGSGYWLPVYAREAAEVIGIEPDPALLSPARSRPGGARVLSGSAEVLRVLRPGGRLVVVDNAVRHPPPPRAGAAPGVPGPRRRPVAGRAPGCAGPELRLRPVLAVPSPGALLTGC